MTTQLLSTLVLAFAPLALVTLLSTAAQAEPPPNENVRIGGFVRIDVERVTEFVKNGWENNIQLYSRTLMAGENAYIHFKQVPSEFGHVILGGRVCEPGRGRYITLGGTYFVITESESLGAGPQPCIKAVIPADEVLRTRHQWKFKDYDVGYLPKPVKAVGPFGVLSMQPGVRAILEGTSPLPRE